MHARAHGNGLMNPLCSYAVINKILAFFSWQQLPQDKWLKSCCTIY